MADEEPIGGGLSGSGVKGRVRSAAAKVALDATSIGKVTAAVKTLNAAVSTLKDNLKSVASHWSDVMGATGTGAGKNSFLPTSTRANMVSNAQMGGGTGGPSGGVGYLAKFGTTITNVGARGMAMADRGLGFVGGKLGAQVPLSTSSLMGMAGTPQMAAGMGAGQLVSQITNAVSSAISSSLNNRIATGYDYSLSADKMNLMYSQMTGMSRLGVSSAFRQPLMNYRLGGPGGINDLMAMQAATGISAVGQASSVEALRTVSGFGYSTADIAKMTTALGSPQVANRMFMTMGTSLYGIGGKQNTTLDVIQSAVKATGLTDERLAQSAMQQGSMSRKRLEFMGLPEDMQNLVIQYAQSNIQFKKKGGQGMYDPSKKADRQLMGDVEGAFATQKEETERVKVEREENFYRRQVDNFADLEKMTQKVTKALGYLEDELSTLIGARTSLGPVGSAAGKGIKGLGTALMTGGGIALAIPGVGTATGVGMMAAGAVLNLAGGFLGDPMETAGGGKAGPGSSSMGTAGPTTAQNIDSTVVPTGNGKTTTIGNIKQWGSFKNLHPTMQQRLVKLMVASGGRVGFGGGVRSSADQRAMFLSRYTPTTEKTDIFWDGKYWKHTSGAPAAPPGRSMHEIGLAADMVGDMGWLEANSSKFGLKNFSQVNGEPWHLQPAELPNGRSAYEKGGAAWGKGPAGSEPYDPTTQFGATDSDGNPLPANTGGGANRLTGLGGQTMGSALDIFKQQSMDELLSGGRGAASSTGAGGLDYGVGAGTTTQQLSGAMSGKEIVNLLKTTGGWTGDDLVTAVAVSWEESRWNPNNHTVNSSTKDNSYGLFQINMDPSVTNPEGNRRAWGLTSNDGLFDPVKNTWVARQKYNWNKTHGRDPWYDWGPHKGAPVAAANNLAMAAATVRSAESGDPYSPGTSGGGGNVTVTNGGTSITIAPIIHMNGQGGNADLQRIAREVGKLLSNEIQATLMRKR